MLSVVDGDRTTGPIRAASRRRGGETGVCELCREHPWRGPGGSPTSWPAPPRKAAHHRESTVYRILRRRNLIEPGRRRPKTRRVVVTSGAAADGVGKVAITKAIASSQTDLGYLM
jgi:hypothetical protein